MSVSFILFFALWVLPPSGVSGTVKSIDGQPVAGARISIVQDAQPPVVTTNAAGAFTLPSVTLPVTIQVEAPGFAVRRVVVRASPVTVVLVPAGLAESVVVTAERAPEWRDASTGTTVLTRADLDAIPGVTTDELLHAVSGLSLYRRSSARVANPTTDGVTMRGLSASGSSRGLVLFDDVPLNDGFGGWVTWTRLPPQAVARIDVDRGPAGDAFGTDALGGLVRIAPGTGEQREAFGSAQIGSLQTRMVDVSGGDTIGGATLFGSASSFTTAGSIPLAPESRGPVDQPTDARWTNAFGRVQFGPADRRWTFAGWGGNDDRGNGTVLQRNRSHGGTFTSSFESSGRGLTFAARASITPNWFYQTFSSVAASRATEKLTSTQTIDADTFRGVVEAGHAVPRGEVQARVSLARADADFLVVTPTASTDSQLRDDSIAASVEAGLAPAPAFTITTGLRREWRTAPTATAATDAATVGHASAAWRANSHLIARTSIATSHRWPTLNELVRDFQVGSVLTKANPNLLPERAWSIDGGATWQASRWLLSANGFDTIVHDAIANVTLSQTGSSIVRQRQNAGEAHAHGLETDAETHITSRLRVRLSATFVDATFRQSLEPALEGNQLPQVPHASVGFEADATLPARMTASLVSRASSAQFDDDRNQFQLAPANQVDVRIAGQWRKIGWQGVVENLFNERIEVGKTPLVTLAPGRAARVGMTFRWR